MLIRNQRAFASGVLFLVVSIFYFVMSFNYATGTAARMGPGFFPRMVSVLFGLIAIGVIFSALSPRAKREDLERWDIKGLLWIAGSVVLFAVLLPTFGLIVALSALIIIASLASPEFTWRGAIVNTIVLNVFCVGVFIYGINLQFPVWPMWFR
jgi:hypothetical protein